MRPALAATDDLDARIPVWVALSDLYLDTDVAPFLDHIARTLAASPYPLDTLRDILLDEVHPALHGNLLQVAGEWAGFDDAWLVAHLCEVRATPLWRRRLSHLSFGLVRDDWRAVETLIAALRQP
jgi:hypothetical protein